MRTWVKDLLAAWHDERIVLTSPMPLEVIRRWMPSTPSRGNFDVVRRSAARLNNRSAWRPALRGRLRRTDSGSQFVGVLGWEPVLKVFTCCLLGAFAGIFVIGTALAAFSASRGDWRAAKGDLGLIAFGLFGIVTGLASTLTGYREARAQTAYLRSWINGRMDAPWYRKSQTFDD